MKTDVPEPSFSKDIDIITGHQGKAHVTAAQEARRIAGIVGKDRYILDVEEKFAITVNSSTQITIGTGDAIIKGRHVAIETPVTLPLKPGKQGVRRGSIVCLRVEPARKNGIDKAKIIILDGEETTGNIEYPYAYIGTSTMDYSIADMSLWLIPIDGITVGKPRPAVDYEILTSLSDVKNEIKSGINNEIADIKAKIDKIMKAGAVYEGKKSVIESQKIPSVYKDDITIGGLSSSYGKLVMKFDKSYKIINKNILTPYKDEVKEITIDVIFSIETTATYSTFKDNDVYPFNNDQENKSHYDGDTKRWTQDGFINVNAISVQTYFPITMGSAQYDVSGNWGGVDDILPYENRSDENDWRYKKTIYGKDHITVYDKKKDSMSFTIDAHYVNAILQDHFRSTPLGKPIRTTFHIRGV